MLTAMNSLTFIGMLTASIFLQRTVLSAKICTIRAAFNFQVLQRTRQFRFLHHFNLKELEVI